ncbi:4Fe-4S dicluster domain-containing protein [Desulfosediminicola flagellatus]|uniref:4Fe-4S dicluster domain-containing protein n=1 Tax=Desulfosediminicola flagellatus TaxID=2569541 RepID=UPI0010ABFE2C|nr:4Fe-4S dicluster domain-containing protein [Desulfosediminicola flagellatus]
MTTLSDTTTNKYIEISLSIKGQNCLRKRLRGFECNTCLKSCIHGALEVEDGEIVIRRDTCTGCGRCVTACPADVFSIPGLDYSEFINLIRKSDSPVVSCFRQNQHSGAYLLPCLGALPIEVIVALGISDIERVYFQTCDCTSCKNSPLIEILNQTFSQIGRLFGDSLQTECILCKQRADLPQTNSENRRKFLIELAANLTSFAEKKFATRRVSKDLTIKSHRRIPQKTRLRNEAVNSADISRYKKISALCFPTLSITENCNLCPRCTGMCPTGAIRIEQTNGNKRLYYDATRCTGCELCAIFCKEKALEITQSPIEVFQRGLY